MKKENLPALKYLCFVWFNFLAASQYLINYLMPKIDQFVDI